MSMTCTKINAKAIVLPCPCCAAEEAGIQINLDYLEDEGCQFTCRDCGEEFGTARIGNFIRKWTRLLAWIDNAPDMDAEADAE